MEYVSTEFKSRDSSVGIATSYGRDGPGVESLWGRDFPHPSRPALGAHPASYTMNTGSFLGVKRPGRGADHPPSIYCRGYLYSSSVPSWPVTGRTFTFIEFKTLIWTRHVARLIRMRNV